MEDVLGSPVDLYLEARRALGFEADSGLGFRWVMFRAWDLGTRDWALRD